MKRVNIVAFNFEAKNNERIGCGRVINQWLDIYTDNLPIIENLILFLLIFEWNSIQNHNIKFDLF